jgi:hypothetical protein
MLLHLGIWSVPRLMVRLGLSSAQGIVNRRAEPGQERPALELLLCGAGVVLVRYLRKRVPIGRVLAVDLKKEGARRWTSQ